MLLFYHGGKETPFKKHVAMPTKLINILKVTPSVILKTNKIL